METKQQDVMALLKLYELRRDELMRQARAWFFSEFNPQSAKDMQCLLALLFLCSGVMEIHPIRTTISHERTDRG